MEHIPDVLDEVGYDYVSSSNLVLRSSQSSNIHAGSMLRSTQEFLSAYTTNRRPRPGPAQICSKHGIQLCSSLARHSTRSSDPRPYVGPRSITKTIHLPIKLTNQNNSTWHPSVDRLPWSQHQSIAC
ncbi:hypothetical protein DSO57_1028991 [Entomophthora muscae]|uniref:Uncharacterized protein n=1 Tax=Entomophthora muscae TaxID=34485 RepID=A0ACC2T1L2_9FUNG|nr:hypothetical protein DSO57_1028991 [Entomophthora muscae]